MKRNNLKNSIIYFLVLFVLISCKEEQKVDLSQFILPDDVQISLVAKEPLFEAPVDIDFDEAGRIWLCEMRSYMPNIEGTEEQTPNGKITILEDRNNDGTYEKSITFMDSLVLPRALALVYGGLLYAVPPNLWFVEINGNEPGKKTLVDSTYALKGNVEHQPNSLMMNIDNWIYSTSSNARYRMRNGEWFKEYTYPRGQWGLTKDKYGRLVYNNNSTILAGDLVLPNALFGNPFLKLEDAYSEVFSADQKVYPIQATAVNRGYQDGVLDENEFLIKTTSACGPLIYQGNSLPAKYNGNAFVCIPEINAIKCLSFEDNALNRNAKPIEENKEFLITKDEGFRPVTLSNGPDGIYVLDFHRGIIQHKAYMTAYLRDKILNRSLDKVIGMGRVLKITGKDDSTLPSIFDFENNAIEYLQSPNVWLRDKSQQYIITNQKVDLKADLIQLMASTKNEAFKIHALYTLEGLGLMSTDLLVANLNVDYPHLSNHLLQLLQMSNIEPAKEDLKKQIVKLIKASNPITDIGLAATIADFSIFSKGEINDYINAILKRNQNNGIHCEAILSNTNNDLNLSNADEVFIKKRTALQNAQQDNKPRSYYTSNIKLEDRRTVGMELYQTYCGTCHGNDGEGKKILAPPLLNSEFVSGPDERLILIALHGMKGPITVNNVDYDLPAAMPGVANNKDLSNADIKDILHFVRNAFASAPYSIQDEDIEKLRAYPSPDGMMYTASKLDSMIQILANE
jgi:mono/diheme cytochrome c family protein